MFEKKIAVLVLLLFFALPALGRTTKTTYSVPCSDLWSAVKEVVNNPDNYAVVSSDDDKWPASYDVKHAAHVNVSGAILQRTNKVTLVTQGTGCQMQVVSNYSGWEHSDRNDFIKRVDEALANTGTPKAAEPAKP